MRVLVVDDEPAVRGSLQALLSDDGLTVDAVSTGGAALAAAAEHRYDCVVLDLVLPDMHGLTVCRRLRRLPGYLPVLMLTCLDHPADELAGFAATADDYVTKPFRPAALLARVRALARRAGTRTGGVLRVGSVDVDLRLREARRDGRRLPLRPREFDLLAFLAEHPGRVFAKSQLLAALWGPDRPDDAHTLENMVSRLRSHIEDNPNRPVHLRTRVRVGYYLHLGADGDG